MALKMTDRVVDGVAVVAMEGRIVLGEESTALREKVKSLLASGQKKIVSQHGQRHLYRQLGTGRSGRRAHQCAIARRAPEAVPSRARNFRKSCR